MPTGVKFESSLGSFASRLAAEFTPTIAKGMMAAGSIVSGQIAREISAWPPSQMSVKTGALARSFTMRLVKSEDGSIRFGVYSDLPYAGIQNSGGMIKPVKATALAVPLTPEARRQSPKQFPGLFRAGNVLATRNARGIRAQYALKSSVQIPAKHYIDNAAEKVLPIAQQRVMDSVREAIRLSTQSGSNR